VRQVEGLGIAGIVAFLILFGRSGADPLFLRCKWAVASVDEAHLGPAAHDNYGERVMACKRTE
jgi:hypothetical protein